MARANTIARCRATLVDGTELVYEDWEPAHIRQQRFTAIVDANPVTFTAETVDGAYFSVNLLNGALYADGQVFETQPQPTPLRLVYFKRMSGTVGTGIPLRPSGREDVVPGPPTCQFFVVGWQTTTPEGQNLRIGIKVFPSDCRWEITEDW